MTLTLSRRPLVLSKNCLTGGAYLISRTIFCNAANVVFLEAKLQIVEPPVSNFLGLNCPKNPKTF